ncbi:LOW QUALITY PROTEIN: hypothetical protein KUTeg_023320 [Tegillarca granosa]|uniref:Kinesin motor domain-containing protein n=1 Tax=Tegillarca granosa TaxID=220873 RepID=A0ABQ9E712_TEGGR|nr:LOW QUALITY PROTEIN: hypothetical protein KUTeg_023320 [Tegillarca granosa]
MEKDEVKEDDTSVRVALRIRPQMAREKIDMCQVCTSVIPSENQVLMGKDKAFTFDYVFDMPTPQDVIYSDCVKVLIEGCFEGYNATVFAYGQTGSGKTYTMGTGFDVNISEDEIGIIPRAVDHLFQGIEERKRLAHERNEPPPDFKVNAQFMELYNEEILDLFDTTRDPESRGKKSHIKIHEDAGGGIYVVGVTTRPVCSLQDTMQCLKFGALSRATASTNMNAQSSRSHAIFTLHVKQQRVIRDDNLEQDKESDSTEGLNEFETLTAKFHFVDLAGSERLKRTGATGDRAKEGISINCGLLALGNVISALGDVTKKGSHVPYRDSKLTRLLQDSLGGNSRTLMIACVSPSDRDFMETLNTLKYANRARNIKNKVIANQDKASKQLAALRSEITRLHEELQEFKTGKRVIDADGVESVNDMFQENTMLQNENEKLRQRLKAMNDTIDSLTNRNTQLIAEKALISVGNISEDAKGDEVSKLIQGYVKEIEELSSDKENISDDEKDQNEADIINQNVVKQEKKKTGKGDIENDEEMAEEDDSEMVDEDVDEDEEDDDDDEEEELEEIEEDSSESEDKGTVQYIKHMLVALFFSMFDNLFSFNSSCLESFFFTYENHKYIDKKFYNLYKHISDLYIHVVISNYSDTWCFIKDIHFFDLFLLSDSDNIHEDLAELTCEISIKQKLIDELEQSTQKLNAMKQHYEEKVSQLQNRIKATEQERDAVLSNINHVESESGDKVKKIKKEYEKKLQDLQMDLKKMQAAKKEHAKLLKNQSHYEKQLKTLQHELGEMKKTKVRLMKQVKEESEKSKMSEARRNKEVAQFRKEQLRKENVIRTLEKEKKQKEMVLRRKQEEVENLRKRQKPMSARAAGRVGKYDRPSTIPIVNPNSPACNNSINVNNTTKTTGDDVSITKPAGDKNNTTPIPTYPRRRRRTDFSAKAAKNKWDAIEKNVSAVVTKKQTISHLEKDMDVWIKQREKLCKKKDKYIRRKENAVKTGKDEADIKNISDYIEIIDNQLLYAQENINECQDEAEDIDISVVISKCNLEEARYLLEKFIQHTITKGLALAQKDNRTNNTLQQDLLKHMIHDRVDIEVDNLMTNALEENESSTSSSSSSPADRTYLYSFIKKKPSVNSSFLKFQTFNIYIFSKS